MKNNPLILADMLASEGSTLAQMNMINDSELQLYKQGIRLIGKAFPMFSGFVQESLDSFSEKKKMPSSRLHTAGRLGTVAP